MVVEDHQLQVIVVVAMAAVVAEVEGLESHAIQSIEVILCSSIVMSDLINVFKNEINVHILYRV